MPHPPEFRPGRRHISRRVPRGSATSAVHVAGKNEQNADLRRRRRRRRRRRSKKTKKKKIEEEEEEDLCLSVCLSVCLSCEEEAVCLSGYGVSFSFSFSFSGVCFFTALPAKPGWTNNHSPLHHRHPHRLLPLRPHLLSLPHPCFILLHPHRDQAHHSTDISFVFATIFCGSDLSTDESFIITSSASR